jgi:hypothetical protein
MVYFPQSFSNLSTQKIDQISMMADARIALPVSATAWDLKPEASVLLSRVVHKVRCGLKGSLQFVLVASRTLYDIWQLGHRARVLRQKPRLDLDRRQSVVQRRNLRLDFGLN